jgi:hypothetical protein
VLNDALQELLQKYAFKGNHRFISNNEIDEFLREHMHEITEEQFKEVYHYFRDTIGVSRYIFREYENIFMAKNNRTAPEVEKLQLVVPGMERFREFLVLKRYSFRTVKAYTGALRRVHCWLVSELGKSVDRITSEDARKFFLELIEVRRVSNSTVRGSAQRHVILRGSFSRKEG